MNTLTLTPDETQSIHFPLCLHSCSPGEGRREQPRSWQPGYSSSSSSCVLRFISTQTPFIHLTLQSAVPLQPLLPEIHSDTKSNVVLHQEWLCSLSWSTNFCCYLASISAGKSGGQTLFQSFLPDQSGSPGWHYPEQPTPYTVCQLKSRTAICMSNFHTWPGQQRIAHLWQTPMAK